MNGLKAFCAVVLLSMAASGQTGITITGRFPFDTTVTFNRARRGGYVDIARYNLSLLLVELVATICGDAPFYSDFWEYDTIGQSDLHYRYGTQHIGDAFLLSGTTCMSCGGAVPCTKEYLKVDLSVVYYLWGAGQQGDSLLVTVSRIFISDSLSRLPDSLRLRFDFRRSPTTNVHHPCLNARSESIMSESFTILGQRVRSPASAGIHFSHHNGRLRLSARGRRD